MILPSSIMFPSSEMNLKNVNQTTGLKYIAPTENVINAHGNLTKKWIFGGVGMGRPDYCKLGRASRKTITL